jgi:formylmethanofuran dehydrogenase subunit C
MTALVFTLKSQLLLPVDLSPLTPDTLAGKNKTQIAAIKLVSGNQKVVVSKLFSIAGTDTENIRIQRSSKLLTHVGQRMSHGKILVRGDVGDYLGKNMSGGSLQVNGNCGDSTACNLRGGLIEIDGDTGDRLGANFIGESHGMNEGTVIVSGNAGNRVGERMRRGTIIIRGHVGHYCAKDMLAGSIIILGKTGHYLGHGMKRGTIILTKKPRHILATFRHCGLLKIEFLRLLFKQMATSNKELLFFNNFGPEAIRYAGDISCEGLGEILVLQNARFSK